MTDSKRIEKGTVNGVNIEQLGDIIKAIEAKPSLGAFEFRADGQWIDGSLNRTEIAGFYGAGEEHVHAPPFTFDADEPPVLLGEDRSANPVEYVLKALAACLTTSLVFHAAARGIEVRALETRLEGDLDLRGFLGMTDEVPKGYQRLRVQMRVDADATPEQLEELARTSPVLNTLQRPIPVALTIEPK